MGTPGTLAPEAARAGFGAPRAGRADDIAGGILSALAAYVCFSGMNVLIKQLELHGFGVGQMVFFRSAFALLPLLPILLRPPGWRQVLSRRPIGHLMRGVIGLGTMFLVFWSFVLLPLAEATTLMFAAPLFLTALSVPLLGEQVGIRRWSAVLVGFAGVCVVMGFSGEAIALPGIACALTAAMGMALVQVQIRQLSQTDSSTSIVFWFTAISTVLAGLAMAWEGWRTPDPLEWLMLLGLGVLGGIGQLLITRAYGCAPGTVIAPFSYTQLLWGALAGWLVFAQVPGWSLWPGALLIIGSGIYIVHRETRLGRGAVAGPGKSGA